MLMRVNKPPAIGLPWQGGYYIGDIVDGGNLFHLVLAPKSIGQNNSLTWGPISNLAGTSATNGWANLQAMIAAGITSFPAGKFCDDLTISGNIDWYLPAIDELVVVYNNRSAIVGADSIDADLTPYWSSTQNPSTSYAWARRFGSGANFGEAKNQPRRCRAVRRIAA